MAKFLPQVEKRLKIFEFKKLSQAGFFQRSRDQKNHRLFRRRRSRKCRQHIFLTKQKQALKKEELLIKEKV